MSGKWNLSEIQVSQDDADAWARQVQQRLDALPTVTVTWPADTKSVLVLPFHFFRAAPVLVPVDSQPGDPQRDQEAAMSELLETFDAAQARHVDLMLLGGPGPSVQRDRVERVYDQATAAGYGRDGAIWLVVHMLQDRHRGNGEVDRDNVR